MASDDEQPRSEIWNDDIPEEILAFAIQDVAAEYEMDEVEIDRGGFASVFRATHKVTGKYFAVKVLLEKKLSLKDYRLFIREVSALWKVRQCRRVVGLVAFTRQAPFTIITPFITGGNLFNRLKAVSGRPSLTSGEKTVIAMGIALGMKDIHATHLMHRDLKSLNILLDTNNYPGICDFGISRPEHDDEEDESLEKTKNMGTVYWMAPEMIEEDDAEGYTKSVDVYSFGILLWEILAEQVPFRAEKSMFKVMRLVKEGVRPPLPDDTPESLRNLITECWGHSGRNRPTFDEVYTRFKRKEVMFGNNDGAAIDEFLRTVGPGPEASDDSLGGDRRSSSEYDKSAPTVSSSDSGPVASCRKDSGDSYSDSLAKGDGSDDSSSGPVLPAPIEQRDSMCSSSQPLNGEDAGPPPARPRSGNDSLSDSDSLDDAPGAIQTSNKCSVASLALARKTGDVLSGYVANVSDEHTLSFFVECESVLQEGVRTGNEVVYELMRLMIERNVNAIDALRRCRAAHGIHWAEDVETESVQLLVKALLCRSTDCFSVEAAVAFLKASETVDLEVVLGVVMSVVMSPDAADKTVMVNEFMARAEVLVSRNGGVSVVKTVHFLLEKNDGIYASKESDINRVMLSVLASNDQQAIHDAYVTLIRFSGYRWPMSFAVMRNHLNNEKLRFIALSYLAKKPLLDDPSIVPLMFDIAQTHTLAVIVLCRMAMIDQALEFFDEHNIPLLASLPNKLEGARILFALAKSGGAIIERIAASERLFSFMKDLLDTESLVFPVSDIVKMMPVTSRTMDYLHKSGLLTMLGSVAFATTNSAMAIRVLSIYRSYARKCPADYESIVAKCTEYVYTQDSDDLVGACLATIKELCVHDAVRMALLRVQAPQKISQITQPEMRETYVGPIFHLCGWSCIPSHRNSTCA